MAFDRQPFASTNPAVDQLFQREFAQNQAQRQAAAQAAANETARQQIMAQSQLAQAQMRDAQAQREYSNLFREREFQSRETGDAARNKILQQNADTEKAYREGLIAKPVARTQSDIDESNAASDALASQYNAAYMTRLNTKKATIEGQRKADIAKLWTLGGMVNRDTTEIDTKYNQMLKDAEDQEFQTVLDIATKYAPPGTIRVDPLTKQFKAVRLVAPGAAPAGAAALSAPTPDPTPGPTTFTGGPVVNPAALGGDLSSFSSVPTVPRGHVTLEEVPENPAALGSTPLPPMPPMPVSQPSVKRLLGSVPILLTPEDDATLTRQLIAIPPEQRPAAYRAMVDQWLRAGRARLVPAAPMTVEPQPNYPRF